MSEYVDGARVNKGADRFVRRGLDQRACAFNVDPVKLAGVAPPLLGHTSRVKHRITARQRPLQGGTVGQIAGANVDARRHH